MSQWVTGQALGHISQVTNDAFWMGGRGFSRSAPFQSTWFYWELCTWGSSEFHDSLWASSIQGCLSPPSLDNCAAGQTRPAPQWKIKSPKEARAQGSFFLLCIWQHEACPARATWRWKKQKQRTKSKTQIKKSKCQWTTFTSSYLYLGTAEHQPTREPSVGLGLVPRCQGYSDFLLHWLNALI